MGCSWTVCGECDHWMNHKLANKCEVCGSADVEWDFEVFDLEPEAEEDQEGEE